MKNSVDNDISSLSSNFPFSHLPEPIGLLLNIITNILILSALINSKIWFKCAIAMKILLLLCLFINLTIYFLRGSDIEFLVTVANVFSMVFSLLFLIF